MNDQFLWIESYRPRNINDCIIPKALNTYFTDIVKQGEIQNMLFHGTSGTGKTTVARALCDMLNVDYIIINGSEESGIDVLRTKIKQFASTVSFKGGIKIVILDEAEYLNANSTQPALRGFMEEFSDNCRFILTCNFRNRIIPALHSRCVNVHFKIPKEEKPKLAMAFFKRLTDILTKENISFDAKVLAKFVEKYFPDFRRTLNELQRYALSGSVDQGILSQVGDVNVKNLIDSLKEKDWKEMRTWVVENSDADSSSIFRTFYDALIPHTEQVPQLVLLLADYQYKSAFVADQEINTVACLTEVMATVELK